MKAFERLASRNGQIHLVMLGNYELSDPLEESVQKIILEHPRIHNIPWSKEPAPVYTVADILVLPSYREGFGNVALEGSAMELPVVASDIVGCREAVIHGETGLLVTRGDDIALEGVLEN